MELLIARNPDAASTLPYLIMVPSNGGLVFRAKDTWPRTAAIYCHPVPHSEWPAEPELVGRIQLRSCERRGVAIDIIADRGREHRSQLVFTTARGREVVFWQPSPLPATGRPRRPRSGPGPGSKGSPSPTGVGSGQRSSPRGRTRTAGRQHADRRSTCATVVR